MRAEFINPFLVATHDVFRVMLNCELTRGELGLKRNRSPEYEVSGLIGLSGRCQGMVVVSLGRSTALQAAEAMLGERCDDLNRDVADAVGELANMIAGAAKTLLEEYELLIGLPTVVCGRNHIVSFPSNSVPVFLPFESKMGPVSVEVGIVENPLSKGGSSAKETAAFSMS